MCPDEQAIRGVIENWAGATGAMEHVRIEARSDVQEVEIAGDWAWCWNYLDVLVTPRARRRAHPALRPYADDLPSPQGLVADRTRRHPAGVGSVEYGR